MRAAVRRAAPITLGLVASRQLTSDGACAYDCESDDPFGISKVAPNETSSKSVRLGLQTLAIIGECALTKPRTLV